MKKTPIRLLVFLFPILLVWGAVEFFYRSVPNNYTLKYDYMERHASEVEVLLLGNSHSLFGLNPDYFSKKAFNLANISQTIYFDQLLFNRYIDKMDHLKQVVFCIEYSSLSHKDDTHEDTFRKYYYENYMQLDVPTVSAWDPKKYSLAFTRNLKQTWDIYQVYRIRGSVLDAKENGWGFTTLKELSIAPAKDAEEKAEIHEDGSLDFAVNLARIEAMIEQCKQRNIEVVIVSMPQSRVYTSLLNPKKLALIFDTCEQLAAEHDHVRYLNLFSDRRFRDEDFFDSDHLNDEAAGKCLKMVNAFLQEK
ncbi:hypothetical protein [Flavobacterium sp.]|uniref:hypothetical protein n=1 Tax=Flavobacterium sp. TaxID=239 RepID=UPI0039E4BCF6